MAEEATSSRLLSLAPELRNRIYEYALLEDDDIIVTAVLKQPTLLRTCSQIRSEALLIWYTKNIFSVPVIDCDGTLDVQWSRHCKSASGSVASRRLKTSNVMWDFSGRPSRLNLMAWLKKNHKDQCWINMPSVQDAPRMVRVVVAAHAMLAEYLEKPWEKFERAMERMWYVLEPFGEGWEDE